MRTALSIFEQIRDEKREPGPVFTDEVPTRTRPARRKKVSRQPSKASRRLSHAVEAKPKKARKARATAPAEPLSQREIARAFAQRTKR